MVEHVRWVVTVDMLAATAELLDEKLAEWMLTDDGWRWDWATGEAQYGLCSYSKKLITISRVLVPLNSMTENADTVLHEVAHALAGSMAGHGWKWQEWCLKVGAKPERTYGAGVTTPAPRYEGVCPVHGVIARRRELGKQFLARGQSCGVCSNVYDERFRLTWVDTRKA